MELELERVVPGQPIIGAGARLIRLIRLILSQWQALLCLVDLDVFVVDVKDL